MPNIRKLAIQVALFATLALPATHAMANTCDEDPFNVSNDHIVILFSNGYFPKRLYAQKGQSVRFVNKTSFQARVPLSSDTYLTSWISSNSCQTITLNANSGFMMLKPVLNNATNNNGKSGDIVYGAAPSQ